MPLKGMYPSNFRFSKENQNDISNTEHKFLYSLQVVGIILTLLYLPGEKADNKFSHLKRNLR